MARAIFSSLRAQAKMFWRCVVSNTEVQSPLPSYTRNTIPRTYTTTPRTYTTTPTSPARTYTPPPPPPYATSSSSFFSCPSSSPTTIPSSSQEREHQPPLLQTTGVDVRPSHRHCPGQSPKHSPISGNVDSASSQSIRDGDSAESSSHATTQPAATTTPLQQADSTNQSYEYPPPFNQILVDSELGKILLSADLSAQLAMIVLLDKNESLGLWRRVVCLLLLLSSVALFFALLLKKLYPAFAMVTVLLGIGCFIAAICAYPLSVFLPHFWVTVLSTIVAFSVMTPIMIIFCLKKYDRTGGMRREIERGDS